MNCKDGCEIENLFVCTIKVKCKVTHTNLLLKPLFSKHNFAIDSYFKVVITPPDISKLEARRKYMLHMYKT